MTSESNDGHALKRTTLRLPDFLYDEITEQAAKERRSLNQLIIEILFDFASGPKTEFREATRNQLLGMQVGMLLALDVEKIHVEGLSGHQKQALIDAVVDHIRSLRDRQNLD